MATLEDYCSIRGIVHQKPIRNSSVQNGMAEKSPSTIEVISKKLRYHSYLPPSFRTLSVQCGAFVHNHLSFNSTAPSDTQYGAQPTTYDSTTSIYQPGPEAEKWDPIVKRFNDVQQPTTEPQLKKAKSESGPVPVEKSMTTIVVMKTIHG
ncbi:uncharacterized protein J8A68_004806 [[Candida] subhashii]|uniref:Uncharacterized protein n=1 Tax=[Candida] subhashii TaxID=561895 RepID=A0A8J5UF15_9ASCO|nr:uncharacterized protein J8A68_004806 [[Candida] subhashii]KAG7661653.1 hypothetical protein J8A68_004806 [[Candida] subhashii]